MSGIVKTNSISQVKTCGFSTFPTTKNRSQIQEQGQEEDVQQLVKNSQIIYINRFLEENNEELRESRLAELSTEKLTEMTKDLASRFANLEVREKAALFKDPNLKINQYIKNLRTESVKRLKSKNVTPENYISTNNDNFLGVLEICEPWLHLESRKTKSSFVFWVINDIGDSETGRSMVRFKHFTVQGFVKFCNLMRHVSLGESFHKFYVLMKFLDLFDDMSETDIADVCSTIVHHQLQLACEHPVNIMIKEKLVKFLDANIDTISSRSLLKICSALNPQLEYNFPQQLVEQMKNIQRRAAADVERFETRALIALLNVSNNRLMTTRNGVDRDLVDALVERLCSSKDKLLSNSKDISMLAFTISKQRDTPRGRYLLTKLGPLLVHYLLAMHTTNSKNVLMATLQMAHLGLYDHTLLDTLFSCPSITHLYPDGQRALTRQLIYPGGYNHQAGLDKAAGDLLMLQGMVELEQSSYTGARITREVEKCLCMATGDSPLEISRQMEADNPSWITRKLAQGYFNSRNLEVYNHLVKITGSSVKVWECYALPCTAQVNYVVGIDRDRDFVDIGHQWRYTPWSHVKHFSQSPTVSWFVVSIYHPLLKQRWSIKTGGEPVLQRLLSRIGAQGIIVNLEDWDDMECDCKEKYLRERITHAIDKINY